MFVARTHPIKIAMYDKSRENLRSAAVTDIILCGSLIGPLSSLCLRFRCAYFGRIRSKAMISSPVTSPALARTLFANPTGPWRRLLSMIGWRMPPREEPDATIPITSARECGVWKCCDTIAIEGM